MTGNHRKPPHAIMVLTPYQGHIKPFVRLAIKIISPDGSVKKGKMFVLPPSNVAEDLSKSLVLNALVARVDGVLWDMSRPLEANCELELYSLYSCEGRDTFWNSIALILAQLRDIIFEVGYNVEVDTSDRLIWDKIEEAEEAQYKYVILAFVELAHPGEVTIVPISDSPDELVTSVEDLLSRFKEKLLLFISHRHLLE